MSERELIEITPSEIRSLHESTVMLGNTVRQLVEIMSVMQRRVEELETLRMQVTVSHGDVKRLNALTRARAKEICGKYGLDDKSEKVIRAAIRKDTLARAGVRDLHDIPATMLPGTERAITAWTNIRLIMERRGT